MLTVVSDMTLYTRIKARREELGMSQEELAGKLGYRDRSTIAKIESGTNDIMQSKIQAFADALDTSPAFLLGWDDLRTASWENRFKSRVGEYIKSSDLSDLRAAGISLDEVMQVVDGRVLLSFERACNLSDQLGLSIDFLVGRDEYDTDSKKAVTDIGDGLSDDASLMRKALDATLDALDVDDIAAVQSLADALKARQENKSR